MWKDGDITATDFAKLLGVSSPTLYKYIQEYKGNKNLFIMNVNK